MLIVTLTTLNQAGHSLNFTKRFDNIDELLVWLSKHPGKTIFENCDEVHVTKSAVVWPDSEKLEVE